MHIQSIKFMMKYPKGIDRQEFFIKTDIEEGIDWYVEADFSRWWNQDEGTEPGSVLSRTGYVITYANWTFIWES